MMFGFGLMDALFPILFTLAFLLVVGIIVVTMARGIGEWHKNNNSPCLVVDAKVVAKRTDITRHQHANAGDMTGAHDYHHSTSTTYYVTFEVKGGERLEFAVSGSEYGQLVESDHGELTFQGTRYVAFLRK